MILYLCSCPRVQYSFRDVTLIPDLRGQYFADISYISSPNNISRYISLTLVSSLKVEEKRIREGLILFELVKDFLFCIFLILY